ncbi:hypothetical protein AURDEDRAFT_129935 [Auricularia subglabra TFB-10046 SS5]|uniref:Uncharacterized protein n=1 Tax=Auricularia subglabra (strain TFB-10046 / SS5) TaxID=717982 RepID=J0WTG0_AURST|nr:hypothetical protein AURDEDRAFT_129935 [Auricularia subglabra TFB-10046 SS5]
MTFHPDVLDDLRGRIDELRSDFSNYFDWSNTLRSFLNIVGLESHIEARDGSASGRAQACIIMWDTLPSKLRDDAELHALYLHRDPCGLWAAITARDTDRRNNSTAGARIRALEASLHAGLDEANEWPVVSFAEGRMRERMTSRPDWYTLEHLEAELQAVATMRALSRQPGGAKQFHIRLQAVVGPLDLEGFNRICKEVDEWQDRVNMASRAR